MRFGDKTIFRDKQLLEEMIKLRRRGWAITSLAIRYSVDVSTIRYHLKKYYIIHPDQVYTVERIIAKVLPLGAHLTVKVVNGERINLGKSYKEYMAEAKLSP